MSLWIATTVGAFKINQLLPFVVGKIIQIPSETIFKASLQSESAGHSEHSAIFINYTPKWASPDVLHNVLKSTLEGYTTPDFAYSRTEGAYFDPDQVLSPRWSFIWDAIGEFSNIPAEKKKSLQILYDIYQMFKVADIPNACNATSDLFASILRNNTFREVSLITSA